MSIFECDLKVHANRADLARNAYKRMRTLRHPYVLAWLDGQESESKLTVVTDYVRPLSEVLREIEQWTDVERNLVSWGVFQVAVRSLTKRFLFLSLFFSRLGVCWPSYLLVDIKFRFIFIRSK